MLCYGDIVVRWTGCEFVCVVYNRFFSEYSVLAAHRVSILAVNNVSKSFGGIKALNNVSFEVEENKITGLKVPNGSGKTVTFDVITGFTKPDKGKKVDGCGTANNHHKTVDGYVAADRQHPFSLKIFS